MNWRARTWVWLSLSALAACPRSPTSAPEPSEERGAQNSSCAANTANRVEQAPAVTSPQPNIGFADIVAVDIRGTEPRYTFAVTIESPDTGCSQYADWWEVLGQDGKLLYRRILAHSHKGEQPFTRTGGPVSMSASEKIIVRAHMNTVGYGGRAMRGTARDGLKEIKPPENFAADLATVEPLPTGCAF